MPAKVRVEKGESVTVTCSVKAITAGLKSLKLKTTAASSQEVNAKNLIIFLKSAFPFLTNVRL